MTDPQPKASLPPNWFIRSAWVVHRAIYRATGGRRGLWAPAAKKWGTLQLTTVGRKSGLVRRAIVGYFEDGEDLVTLAMNGWMAADPAWWLNLQAHPEATITMKDGVRRIRGRAATGAERERLWARWRDHGEKLDVWASRRPSETAVVILSPIDEGPSGP